jgi:hypothetical protein
MKHSVMAVFCGCLLSVGATRSAYSLDSPPPEAFLVLPRETHSQPQITGYLKYQVEMAWREDEQRRREWSRIHTEPDLLRLQQRIREELLAMIGGLPSEKTQ